MNRRTFLKKLGALAGLALVAPKALFAKKEWSEEIVDLANGKAITQGTIYSGGKTVFNNKDYGVITFKTPATMTYGNK
ncbi:twin-arginine translocation signal domain-containing protein [Candidatus Pacearchaeota archaeon]|nr:twin-arginine translocation signal domain-containing protein [Candidatus Pacearchaeota archaeon]